MDYIFLPFARMIVDILIFVAYQTLSGHLKKKFRPIT